MNKLLLTDLDDCVFQWSEHFRKVFYEDTGHEASAFHHHESIAYGHLDFNYLNKVITEFNDSDHFENLVPIRNSVDILPKLKENGWTIVGITACGTGDNVKNRRWKNVKSVFGDSLFSDIKFIEYFQCKSIYLKDYQNGVFVDDNVGHTETAAKLGHTSIIINRSFRDDFSHPEILCLNDWDEIYKEISK